MKLRNKKTGGIVEFDVIGGQLFFKRLDKKTDKISFSSLAELNDAWEDYQEPNIYYFIDIHGEIKQMEYHKFNWQDDMKQIGNYFETKEEAEKAVEKLRVWKRLKDGGCKIVGWDYSVNVDLNGCKFDDDDFIIGLSAGDIDENDLDLLFGGEE